MAPEKPFSNALPVEPEAVETYEFDRDGGIPNSPMPLVVYRRVAPSADDLALYFEALFARHGWTNTWRDGIYDFDHFHSNTHEVLGIAHGRARVRFGGAGGRSLELGRGNVACLPAGTGHCCEAASADLLVIGATPDARSFDIRRGDLAEYAEVCANLRRVPLPRQGSGRRRERPLDQTMAAYRAGAGVSGWVLRWDGPG